MLNILNPNQCCGCTACASICPKHAIEMKPDSLGFMYPFVEKSKCVNCGLCEKVCSFNDNYDKSDNLDSSIVFGARHKDMSELQTSRSGAAFIALSDVILNRGGVVYGAGYKDHFRVAHKRAETKAERDEFKGSKYVQSDLGNVFNDVKYDLMQQRDVLFSGTSCQVAGLKSFLKFSAKKYLDHLFTVDIVCHGAPSPYIWRDYLAFLEQKLNKRATAVNFRDKQKFGWYAHQESFDFGGEYLTTKSYTYTFYQHIMFRKSCAICHFANVKKPGDVTIADFWGWEKVDATFNADDKGASLVLCNTEKGLRLFSDAKEKMNVIESDLETCVQYNLQKPTPAHKYRDKFEKDYVKYGLEYVLKRYGDLGWRYKYGPYISKMKKIVKWFLRR